MNDISLIKAGRCECHLQRVGNVACFHRRTKLPGDDVAREVVEDRRQVIPAPADDLEVGEVGLPELIGRRRLVFELVGGLYHGECRACDQVMRLQKAIHACFRDEVRHLVRERHGQFAGRQLRPLERHVENFPAHIVRNAVPGTAWP